MKRTIRTRRHCCAFQRSCLFLFAVLAIQSSYRIGANASCCPGSSYGGYLGRGRSCYGGRCDDRRTRRNSFNRYFPRRYDYHRRSGTRQDCVSFPRRQYNTGTSMMNLVRDIFSIPIGSCDTVNSLLRQQLKQQVQQSASPMRAATPGPRTQPTQKAPIYAVEEFRNHVELTMELPGVDARDLNVELAHERGIFVLTVRGTRRSRQHVSMVESTFEEAFQLDTDAIDVDAIQAKLSSGILTVTAPKRVIQGKMKNRRLEIVAEGDDRDDVESIEVETTNDAEGGSADPAKTSTKAEISIGQKEHDDFFISEDEDIGM